MRISDWSSDVCSSDLLDVPLDYEQPEGKLLTLFITRAPAEGERLGALFVNPGGPGASAAEMAAVLPMILPGEITDHFDIIGVDPRGLGGRSQIDSRVHAPEPDGGASPREAPPAT